MMMSKPIALIFPKCDRPYLPKVRSPLFSQSTIAHLFLKCN
ncbi:hypothetical protein QUB53_26560 [Microcoleus sp. AT8-B4]